MAKLDTRNLLAPEGPGSFGWEEHVAALKGHGQQAGPDKETIDKFSDTGMLLESGYRKSISEKGVFVDGVAARGYVEAVVETIKIPTGSLKVCADEEHIYDATYLLKLSDGHEAAYLALAMNTEDANKAHDLAFGDLRDGSHVVKWAVKSILNDLWHSANQIPAETAEALIKRIGKAT